MESSKSISSYLSEAGADLSEELRYKYLRITPDGLFVDDTVREDVVAAYNRWSTNSVSEHALFGPDKKQKTSYLLDGKSLLIGSLIRFEDSLQCKAPIPDFRGSLLDTTDYIHMKDRIFEGTDGVTTSLNSRGFSISITSRKHPLNLSNADLLKILSALRQSPILSKRYPDVSKTARHIVPALADIWKKARVISSSTRLLIPGDIPDPKSSWFLLSGDLVFAQKSDHQFITTYGLRGKNLHEFLVHEAEQLRNRKKKFPVKDFKIHSKGRALGSFRFEGESYSVDPGCLKKLLERVPTARDLPDKTPPRFTLEYVLIQLAKLGIQSKWVDAVHVPRTFSTPFPTGTNYRSYKNWFFAISKKKSVVGIYDRHQRDTVFKGLVGLSPDRKNQKPKNKSIENRSAEDRK